MAWLALLDTAWNLLRLGPEGAGRTIHHATTSGIDATT
jgi:hypothetical protein